MLKTSFKKILLFFFVKYFIFYIVMMFKNNVFSLIQLNTISNIQDVFYYCWTFLFYPILCFILFSMPIYFALKAKKPIYFISLMCVVLLSEYSIYTYLDSQLDLMNGIYNGIISLIMFVLFFFKNIMKIFNLNTTATNPH